MFKVKFLFLREKRKEEYEYDSLFDAIRVAKETNIGGYRMHKAAMSDLVFNEKLWTLLTCGFIYVGKRSGECPEGEIMVMLLKDDYKGETPVFNGAIQFDYIKSLENIQKLS